MNHTTHSIKSSELLPRRAHSKLDNMPIHVGDIVHLRPAQGPEIRAQVIYNAPINGTVTYTTEVVRPRGCTDQPGMRIRFRHEHVHRIEPLRKQAA